MNIDDRRPIDLRTHSDRTFQMAITMQHVIRSTSCLVQGWGFRQRRIDRTLFRVRWVTVYWYRANVTGSVTKGRFGHRRKAYGVLPESWGPRTPMGLAATIGIWWKMGWMHRGMA